jgi:hypothetical protein
MAIERRRNWYGDTPETDEQRRKANDKFTKHQTRINAVGNLRRTFSGIYVPRDDECIETMPQET